MKLKLDDKGNAVLTDGKPVYVGDDGTETAFDGPAMHASIKRLNAEAKGHRERAEKAETSLANFAGIDDADAARKALETVQNLTDKKLVDAGEVEKVKAAVASDWQKKLTVEQSKSQGLEKALAEEIIGGSFARSKYITEKLTIPSDLARSAFGAAFKIEDGKVVGYQNGESIKSKSNPAEAAGFDEALAHLVSLYPHKDTILKADQRPGTSPPPGGGTGRVPSGTAGNLGGNKTERTAAIGRMFPELQQA